ncbi:copper chaperone PCu(A)C [Corynebacterium sp. ES2794-CONJ1]|uniref:copper chaperone PCu(A)C n=1 Tax=unclassified Corynebacterium TaxID=2624378 RepID=UPI002168F6EB|nr:MULTISPECIES: copper chaperone PCu(A)C [unclassified Corynebacterium]MCS4491025.1 copper chaperone PCu(A)C [Corynebacterium sp. ES2715-CONJ3]MCS4531094.1 copper chaperone PCu(A)C [Corynebacterium sp. ES2730-CONJ]MCU9518461.1 copper chaperone PCu(A)C [Corynebacterium sp. ES2794-CONJ1]
MKSLFVRRAGLAASAVALTGLALVGCSDKEAGSPLIEDPIATTISPEEEILEDTPALTFSDAYVKAAGVDSGMTAIFGVLHNNSDQDLHITSFSADIDAAKFEIHEVVDGKMQQKLDGLMIPAGQTAVLEPGHDHFMILGLTEPVLAGDDLDIELRLADGSELEFEDIPVRTISAGDEDYSMDHMDHDKMDHDDKMEKMEK